MTDDTATPSRSAASAARRATADERVFLIPEEALPPGFGERVASGSWAPVPARAAATVVLLRDAEGGPEALLLRRHRRSGFAAGAWVFPGGVVDDEDRAPAVAARMDGPGPGEWAARLGLGDPSEARGYVAAALREAFEETGILLARDEDGGAPHVPGAAAEELRRALLAGEVSLAGAAERLRVRLAADEVVYAAHWITPEPEPRRYDTRFFVAHVGPDAVCTPHQAELTEARWMHPAAAVEAFRQGEIGLLPPTVDTLRRLAGFRSWAEARDALRDAPVPAILPTMRRRPDGVAIEIP